MIFSENWLKQWVDPKMDTQELMHQLTMAGLEVDGSTAVARQFSGILVAEVQAVEQHPDADKLSVCQVFDGEKSYQVVCGAPNVRKGLKVPFALVGAEIVDDKDAKPFKIKLAKLRGIESQGMLCSAEELGLEENSTGILELPGDATIGQDIREYFQLDDISIELDLTPNRGDCLGMLGLAREVAVLCRQDISQPESSQLESTAADEFPITITAKDGCPRYLGRVIKGINLNSESPLWMQEKLRRCGLRSIDPIVDVTNYVLMELGQPMHAFDYSKLEGHIDVRMATENEKITLLDGREISLTPDILLITDEKKAVAIAGIMGGLATSVTKGTMDVFLECAFFPPLAIAGKARRFGMHTDASHRYERGVDYQLQHRAMQRATELLLAIVGGEAGPVTEAIGNLPAPLQVELNLGTVSRVLGIEIAHSEVMDILIRLGFLIVSESEVSILVEVPSFRFDVSIEADLIEEIARIYGYNNIPKTGGFGSQTLAARPEARVSMSRIRHQLVDLGYQEVVTYSFIDPALSELVCGPEASPVKLENPISEEMAVMRTSILPGLLSTLKYNANRQQERLRMFESGLVFSSQESDYQQVSMISGIISGSKYPENWNNNKEMNDFYDVKGNVESLLDLGEITRHHRYVPAQTSCFHPGQCARIESGTGHTIGHVGALHPAISREMDLSGKIFLFELVLEQVQKAELPKAGRLSRYPEVSRDLAIVIEESVPADAILALVRDQAGEFLTNLRIFDVYQGDAVSKSKKSIALGLTWQHPSRTLSDEEINTIISCCVNALQEQFNANLRD